METLIVVVIVALAALLVGRRIRAALSPRRAACSQDVPACGGCSSGCGQPIQIRTLKRQER